MKRKTDQADIIDTALSILDDQGLAAVTLKNVASELNIKSPSLYNHVDNLDDLLSMVAIRCLDNLYNALVNTVIGLSERDALLALSNEYRAFFKKHPGQYSLIQSVTIWQHNLEAKGASDKILQLAGKILEKSDLSQDGMIHFIRVWRSFMHGFLSLETNGDFGLEQSVNDSFNYGLRVLLNSL